MSLFPEIKRLYNLEITSGGAERLSEMKEAQEEAHTAVYLDTGRSGTEGLTLLKRILGATKLPEAGFLIIDVNRYPGLRFRHLSGQFPKLDHVISFGVMPDRIGWMVEVRLNSVTATAGPDLLYTADLADLGEDQRLKKGLWDAVRKLFGL